MNYLNRDDYPGLDIYRDGRILNCGEAVYISMHDKTKTPRRTKGSYKNGYLYTRIGDREIGNHVIIATCWVPNPRPNLFDRVDHVDGNESNNSATNLRWVTNQLNVLNQRSTHIPKRKGKNRFMVYRAQNVLRVNGEKVRVYSKHHSNELEALQDQDYVRKLVFQDLYTRLTDGTMKSEVQCQRETHDYIINKFN
jgi:hypothetical protein